MSQLKKAILRNAHLEGADFAGAYLFMANLEGAFLEGADFAMADLEEANLLGAHQLTIEQLSRAKTLHNAKLDEKLRIQLKMRYPELFESPDKGHSITSSSRINFIHNK